MRIVIDIETVPDQNEGALERAREQMNVPGSYKKLETIEQYKDTHMAEEWHKTALDHRGQIVCIGFCINGDPLCSTMAGSESDLIRQFWTSFDNLAAEVPEHDKLRRPLWIGHNIAFDLNRLWQAHVMNGINPPRVLPECKAWNTEAVYDTMYGWTRGERGKYISLRKLCQALGVESQLPEWEDKNHAELVREWYKAGLMDSIAKGCAEDVRQTWECYKRLTFHD